MAGKLPGGAADGPGIDAAMSLEALILSVDQQGEVAPIDLRRLDGEAPATIGARVGAQEAIVAIENRDGEVVGDLERCNRKRRPACRDGDEEGEQGEQEPQAPHGRAQTPWGPGRGAGGLRLAAGLAAGGASTTMPDGPQPREQLMPAKRTTHRSSKGTKLYAVRDKKGQFEDIQTYKRAHGQDIKRKSKAETKRKAR